MRWAIGVSALVVGIGCGARQVEVRTAAVPDPTLPAIHVTNTLAQAVNVYVVTGGGIEMFVRQVPPNSAQHCPVSGVRAGATVGLKAVTVDLQRTVSRGGVVLAGTVSFTIP
jgi:hypothetical protein